VLEELLVQEVTKDVMVPREFQDLLVIEVTMDWMVSQVKWDSRVRKVMLVQMVLLVPRVCLEMLRKLVRVPVVHQVRQV